jgi:hypothetical protein
MNPRARPQSEQRLRLRVENFGGFFALAIHAIVAIFSPVVSLFYETSSLRALKE